MVSSSLLRVITGPPGPRLGVSPDDIPWSRYKTPAYAIDVRPVDLPPGASWIRHLYPSPSRGLPERGLPERGREYSDQPNAAYSPIGLRPDSRRLVLVSIPDYHYLRAQCGICWLVGLSRRFGTAREPLARSVPVWPRLGPVELPAILLVA